MSAHHEVETTFAASDDAEIPDLTAVNGVDVVRGLDPVVLEAVYYDTPGLRLVRAGVSLRRRTGGEDEGWHLKVPSDAGRDEYFRPLGTGSTPPKALRDLALGWTRGEPLSPIATIATERSRRHLVGPEGDVLAELADDRVVGRAQGAEDGDALRWREWEVELVDGDVGLLGSVEKVFHRHGVRRAEVSRKIEHTLVDLLPPTVRLHTPKPGKPVERLVHTRLAAQVDALARRDVGARRGDDDGVHRMRVASRRLRSLLSSFGAVLDRDVTDPIREELRWLASTLGTARDGAVVHERLRALVAEEPRELVHGPVLRRLRSTYPGRGKAELREVLVSARYLSLRARLDALVLDPPWTEAADRPARDVVPGILRKELRRYRRALRTAGRPGAGADELHEARKAAKRLRYAAETVEPVVGKPARRLARDAKAVTSHLGEIQDAAVTVTELVALAHAAARAGEPSFTYGVLLARVETRAARLEADYWAWDTLDMLKSGTRRAGMAVREK